MINLPGRSPKQTRTKVIYGLKLANVAVPVALVYYVRKAVEHLRFYLPP